MEDSQYLRSQRSLYISQRLCISYVSSSRLKLHRSLTKAEEDIHSELELPEFCMVRTGSGIEGLMLKGSDDDRMLVLPYLIATAKSNRHESSLYQCELIMDMENVRPGFSKLKLDESNASGKHILPEVIRISLSDENDRSSHISSDKFRDYYVKQYHSFFDHLDMSVMEHGPCSKIEDKTAYGAYLECADIAMVIKCRGWPEEAMEWVSRPRPKGWPPKYEISRLKEMPCYLLPVGDPKSEQCRLEWRFAFVHAERELIWNFNDTQIHCLLLLKLIKNFYLEALAPDQLSSFYFKTIIFWMSEEHGLDMWYPENLLDCIQQCLEILNNSIKSRHLAHYIYRSRNLLYAKFCDKQQQTAVLEEIRKIQDNKIHYIVEILDTKNEYDRFINSVERGKSLNNPRTRAHVENLQKAKEWKYRHFQIQGFLFRFKHSRVDAKFYRLIESMKKNKFNIEESNQTSILSILSIVTGKSIMLDIDQTIDTNTKASLIKRAYQYFTEGQSLDSISGSLYLATFFYICKKHGNALEIIKEVCSTSNIERSLYLGIIAAKESLLLSSGKTWEELIYSDKKLAAYDVIFTPKDANAVPHAVKFELALHRKCMSVIFHPLVYAYYLYFQICLDSKKFEDCDMATCKLFVFLNLVPKEYKYPHNTYNLLGFCFYKSGWYGAALHCFRKSLLMYMDKKNAAALHLWFMFLDMDSKQ